MKCTCSIRYMEAGGKQVLDLAQIDFCPLHLAAPDLLEALKAFTPLQEGLMLRIFPREGGKTSLAKAMVLATKALAKAEA